MVRLGEHRRVSCWLEGGVDPPMPLLEVENLKKYFPVQKGVLTRTVGHVKAVDGVSFSLNRERPWGWWARAAAAKPPSGAACSG